MTNNTEVKTTGGEDSTAESVWISNLPKWLDDPQTPPEVLEEAIAKAYLAEQEKNEE